MKLRVGVIGLGDAWESRHKPALRALSDRFEVRAICAEVSRRAEQVAHEFNAKNVDGFRALTSREDIDAVLMLAQDWVGPLPILAACEAGKAVYTSTALEIDPAQAREVKKRVEASGVAFMAELPRRHAAATIRLKELIATKLGRPQLLFCHQRNTSDERLKPGSPRAQCPSSMRELMELVDWCRYVINTEPTSVVGVEHSPASAETGTEDYLMLSLEFPQTSESDSSSIAQISRGQYIQNAWQGANAFRPPAALQICCERGVAFVDLPSTLIWFDEAGQHLESLDSERPVGEQLLTHFHRAVTSLVRKTSDLDDAYRALHIVLTAQESCQQGRRLPIEY